MKRQLKRLSSKNIGELKDAHIKDYSGLFNRFEISLGNSDEKISLLISGLRNITRETLILILSHFFYNTTDILSYHAQGKTHLFLPTSGLME